MNHVRNADRWLLLLWLTALSFLPGCEVVKGIFKAGVWTGVLGIAVLVGIAFWVLSRLRRAD